MWLAGIGLGMHAHLPTPPPALVLGVEGPGCECRLPLSSMPPPSPPAPAPQVLRALRTHRQRYPASAAQVGCPAPVYTCIYRYSAPRAANGTVQPVDLPLGHLAPYTLTVHVPLVLPVPMAMDLLVCTARPCQYAPGHVRYYPQARWIPWETAPWSYASHEPIAGQCGVFYRAVVHPPLHCTLVS
jgi:hypothetical protein